MVDLLEALKQRQSEIRGQLPQQPTRGAQALQQQLRMAQMLQQGSQSTDSPIVAALAGFLGGQQMAGVQQGAQELDQFTQDAALRDEARKQTLQEMQLQQQAEQNAIDREFQRQSIGLRAQQIQTMQDRMAQELELAQMEMERAGQPLTEGQKAVDKKFADEFIEFQAKGGFADAQKSINQLKEVRGQLASGEVGTGAERTLVPGFLEETLIPKSKAAQESVEEVVQRNLRLVLGPQFTEKEGERLISRAYNPKLGEEENIKRLDRLIGQIESAAQAKRSSSEYFQRFGTLKGWGGSQPSLKDFERALEADTSENFSEMSDEDLMKLLGQ